MAAALTTEELARLDFRLAQALITFRERNRAAVIDPNVEFHGLTTPDFRSNMLDAYYELPKSVRGYLKSKKARFAIGGIKDDIRPDRKSFMREKSKDDGRIHQNQSDGTYYPDENLVTVTQYIYNPRIDPTVGLVPDERGVLNDEWQVQDLIRLRGVLRHETGHSVDKNFDYLSQTDGFKAAYQTDIERLGGTQAARDKDFGYFVQDDKPGVGESEAFAETWGANNGGGCDGLRILSAFPETAAWVQNFQNKFERAYAISPNAVDDLIYDVHHPLPTPDSDSLGLEAEAKKGADFRREMLRAPGDKYLLDNFNDFMTKIESEPRLIDPAIRKQFANAPKSFLEPYSSFRETLFSALRQTYDMETDPVGAHAINYFANIVDHHTDSTATLLNQDGVKALQSQYNEIDALLAQERTGSRGYHAQKLRLHIDSATREALFTGDDVKRPVHLSRSPPPVREFTSFVASAFDDLIDQKVPRTGLAIAPELKERLTAYRDSIIANFKGEPLPVAKIKPVVVPEGKITAAQLLPPKPIETGGLTGLARRTGRFAPLMEHAGHGATAGVAALGVLGVAGSLASGQFQSDMQGGSGQKAAAITNLAANGANAAGGVVMSGTEALSKMAPEARGLLVGAESSLGVASRIAGRAAIPLALVAGAADAAVGWQQHDPKRVAGALGGTLGGIGAGFALGAVGGSIGGPPGAIIGGVVGGVVGGFVGEKAAKKYATTVTAKVMHVADHIANSAPVQAVSNAVKSFNHAAIGFAQKHPILASIGAALFPPLALEVGASALFSGGRGQPAPAKAPPPPAPPQPRTPPAPPQAVPQNQIIHPKAKPVHHNPKVADRKPRPAEHHRAALKVQASKASLAATDSQRDQAIKPHKGQGSHASANLTPDTETQWLNLKELEYQQNAAGKPVTERDITSYLQSQLPKSEAAGQAEVAALKAKALKDQQASRRKPTMTFQ